MPAIQSIICGAIIAAFISLGAVIFLQHHQIVADKTNYENLLKQGTALQVENMNWKIAAENQNQKIAQLGMQQKALAAAAEKAVAAVVIRTKHYSTLVAKIAVLQPSADDCASAKAVKDFYLQNRK